jgi:DNA-binding CsgD family transcriptional regulator
MDPSALSAYRESVHCIDPWALKLPRTDVTVPDVIAGQSVISHHDLVKTEYYAIFGKQHGLTRALFTVLQHRGPFYAVVSASRNDRAEEFDDHNVAVLQALTPHLRRALQIYRRLSSIGAMDRLAEKTLERAGLGVLLLDKRLLPVFVNRVAHRIVVARDGLTLDASGLCAARPEERSRLQALVAHAARSLKKIGVEPGGALRVSRPSGRRPFEVLVTPLNLPDWPAWSEAVRVVLFIRDPDAGDEPDHALLSDSYGLTTVESEIALALGAGRSANQIADARRISRGTARWYVKRVLEKTQARTQSEVVHRVVKVTRHAQNGPRPGRPHE